MKWMFVSLCEGRKSIVSEEDNTEIRKKEHQGGLYKWIDKPAFMPPYKDSKKWVNNTFWIVEMLEFMLLIICYFLFNLIGVQVIYRPIFYVMGSTSSAAMVVENIAIIFPILFILIIWGMLVQRRKPSSFGFIRHNIVKSYLKGLLMGFLLLSASLLISVVTGSMKITGLSNNINVLTQIMLLFSFCIQGMGEETLCRGFFITSFSRRYPVVIAVVINSAAFAALHLMNPGVGILPEINLVLFGVSASLYFIYTENIWGLGALHGMWNYVQGNLYGVKVSGITLEDTIFTSEAVRGKELVNGGDFGLEGGIGVTIVYSAMIIVILILMKKKKDNAAKEDNAVKENNAVRENNAAKEDNAVQ